MTKQKPPKSIRPDFCLEQAHYDRGVQYVAGVDEAGRGPLAGPVVAAAVILDPANYPDGLNDSKKLSPKRREVLFTQIVSSAIISISSAPPSLIASVNIRGATLWAMRAAVAALDAPVGHVLVDGRDVPPGLKCPATTVIGGDGRSLSIAAASIVAKVTRDRMCEALDVEFPEFGFAQHKGYGTASHMSAISRSAPTVHHRHTFAPIAAALRSINPTN